MGLFDIGKDILIALYDNSPTSPMMNNRARADFERMKRQREMQDRFPAIQNTNSSGNIAGKVLVGAAAVGGAMLLKHIFGSDDKKENSNTVNNQTQPSNK